MRFWGENLSEEPKIKSKWSTRRKLLVAFASLAVVAMLVIFPGLFWELHEANKTLRGFSDALIAKQYERAYGFTSPELRTFTNYTTFVKAHDGLTLRLGDLRNIEVSQIDVEDHSDGWYATADAHVIFARGSLPFIFVLKKENGSWQIYSYYEQ